MRPDPRTLLRGVAKFVAVVVAAGLAGALIGIGLAELSGNDTADAPVLPAATEQTSTSATQTRSSTTPAGRTSTSGSSSTTSTSTTAVVYRVPRVQILSAELGPISESTGRALVAIRARLTNRGNRALEIKTPALLSGDGEVPLGASARDAAGPLLKPIAPGDSATGVLRFTLPGEIAQRVTANPGARLRLGNRTVVVKLEASG